MAKSDQGAPEPIAIIGFACRLPGGNYSPHQLWDFLERGEIAWNGVPPTRFNLAGHYDGSMKPKTMRQPGGMFLKDIDLADFDAGFFEVGTGEATAMDPNQRQILEVVYEGLENAGIPMDKLDNQVVGCYVGSYGVDYADMASRDPEDRPLGNVVGIARCVMANRISHFLNLKGPSITLDTACSGSLVGLDLACQNLRSGTIKMGIVATSNLYMSPEHVIDAGNVGGAHSPTALCHTFDLAADGYVKAEAVSTAIVKRLSDAIRDRDPIRGIVLGTASNHNGRTAGIASPNAESQALAIRAAYANAGITDFSQTTFLECHGTGTQAGDANEVRGIASVFAAGRSDDKPLIIGSIKSNVGHSEPAAGLSGLMKAIMSIEKGAIPGNPTFITPNPKIDFAAAKVKVSRVLVKWPEDAPRRASINSFGIGGSNAHAIVQQVDPLDAVNHTSSYIDVEKDFDADNHEASRPSVLVLSANDAASLSANIKAFCTHLINPRVKSAGHDSSTAPFVTTTTTDIREDDFTMSKSGSQPPKIGFIFTGQGAQWAQMGKDLLEMFPWTRAILEGLDQVLQAQPDPPAWSLFSELTEPRSAKHMRQPDISQTLVTALQLCIFAVLESWNIKPTSVVGHSSGECAAAYAAGWLDRAGALKAAYYRGRAAINRASESEKEVGMLAVGLGAEGVAEFLEEHKESVSIACYNSPNSLTLSGKKPALEDIASKIKAAGHFARMLLVDMAYHSKFMDITGEEYRRLLETDDEFLPLANSSSGVSMFSSVAGARKKTPADSSYWLANMSSPVRFDDALKEMITQDSPTLLVEIGPSGALAGPVAQILKALPNGKDVTYCSSWSRGSNAGKSLFDVAGRIYATGGPINLSLVNDYRDTVRTIIDLPNYSWNHSVKYWHESAASKDWRFRKFPVHDLLGSKVPGIPWTSPVWRHTLNVANVPWILDHKMGGDAIMPGAGFLTLGLEALYQKHCALNEKEAPASANELCYRFRNVRFNRAMVLEEGKDVRLILSLSQVPGSKEWHEFRISTTEADVEVEHCFGLVRIQDPVNEKLDDIAPLEHPQNAKQWYKAEAEIGMDFGPDFQKLISIEATSGLRSCRTLMSLAPPSSKWSPQSYYPVHPAALDGCFQTPIPANAVGERVNVRDVMIPAMFDDVLINSVPSRLHEGVSYATSVYSGRGRPDQDKSWKANSSIYDSATGKLVVRVTGINYVKLDVAPKPDPHVFDRISWQPDISLLTQDQMMYLDVEKAQTMIDRVIDLIAHKKPALKILEVHLEETDTSCLWFGAGNSPARAAYSRYDFASTDAKALVAVQAKHEGADGTSFSVVKPDIEGLGIPAEVIYDLVIVKSSIKVQLETDEAMRNLKPLLAADGLTLVNQSPQSPGTPPTSWGSDGDRPSSSLDSTASDLEASKTAQDDVGSLERFSRRRRERIHEPSPILTIAATDDGSLGFLSRNPTKTAPSTSRHRLLVASLKGTSKPALGPSLLATLSASGWEIIQQTYPFPPVPAGTVVLIVDELSHHVLRHASEPQWEAIKALVTSGNPLLWVTKGSQHPVTDPDNALVHGLFRVARQEDQSLKLTTLGVQSSTSRATEWAIDRVLQLLAQDASPETQYMERDGVLHIQRLIPDAAVNDFKRAEVEGLEPVSKPFHNNEAQIMLRTERIGTLQSLTWCETDVEELPLEPGWVEVEVRAGGVNFKDVAITMGIVADNEYTIGVECAGPIRRIGSNVTRFKVGDRVCVLKPGTYANRAHAEADRCHLIPDTMTYEEAATIPSVYLCSLYSLYHLADIQEGQSVLIHSATGGVGIACIGLARYRKAEIYVTVGTEEKREFLEKNYGIPRSRMYSSRSTDFASEIIRETDGRGVDVIVNSLTGELLDASWRIVADGGIMVEIGKRDIIDRNTLAMEPFDRNCSFRAVDMSYGKHMDEKKVAKLFEELFALIKAGHLQPIHPVTIFGFNQIPAALAHIRAGRHMGKIIISNQQTEDLQVPVRPAVRKLKLLPDVSYLVVGGLRGACGTLIVHMAQHGARHIVVNNRSGIQDDASAKIVRDCLSHGCVVTEARGDVGDYEVVSGIFKDTVPRIAGVVHGPMVLNDKPYENMTVDDYHSTLHAKVNGAWNLHRASTQVLKQPLDFFTMLSSISGIVGRKGQANYAAANTFLDAFASYRQLQGLRANAADLGMIVDVGHIADDETGLEDKFDKTRWIPVNEAMLRRILTYSILQQDPNTQLNKESSTQIITGISYPLSLDEAHLVYDARFSYLYAGRGRQVGPDTSGDTSDKGDQALRTFQVMHKAEADTSSMVNACVEALSGQFAKILQLLGPVEPGKPLMAYGLDSLSAIELRNWTRAKMGVELTTLDIINASSLIALGEKVVSKLTQSEDASK
ncbi:beta-ketoacyl synthase domain-containing protein [Trichoderma citrinoviride]|uniref:Beta-ketoacyl synthase domain-containing protein n=1 Tax=Trichoderma citrinoviride TaxID=58853 RepID=A0A2T4BBQ9_9HYPO|nr:beta-ketoacyl synthase domain-containing protein [Trichoderma citrinoviride]PTB66757.1 beta-ketoacyl synthase domain-containing protein [Trichoderma citrinoviride]